jgi:hypothetical protein
MAERILRHESPDWDSAPIPLFFEIVFDGSSVPLAHGELGAHHENKKSRILAGSS